MSNILKQIKESKPTQFNERKHFTAGQNVFIFAHVPYDREIEIVQAQIERVEYDTAQEHFYYWINYQDEFRAISIIVKDSYADECIFETYKDALDRLPIEKSIFEG